MERVAVELGRIGFANMGDYMRVGPSGDPVLDFWKLTRERAAALTEVTVDDYVDGRGEAAREVRKVKFKLGDKRAALMDIAKLFGWIIERRENKIVDEFDNDDRRAGRGVAGRAGGGPGEGAASRHRGGARGPAASGRCDRRRRRGASLTNIPMVGKGADGQRPKWGDDRGICDASLGRRIRA